MKSIIISVTEEQHKMVKTEASKNSMSMKDYILMLVKNNIKK